jgi:hypothetical protein
MLNTDVDAATLAAAKFAVREAVRYRGLVSDTPAWEEVFEEVRDLQRVAKASGLPISPADWVYLADLVNEACDDDGLPRLFVVEGADA